MLLKSLFVLASFLLSFSHVDRAGAGEQASKIFQVEPGSLVRWQADARNRQEGVVVGSNSEELLVLSDKGRVDSLTTARIELLERCDRQVDPSRVLFLAAIAGLAGVVAGPALMNQSGELGSPWPIVIGGGVGILAGTAIGFLLPTKRWTRIYPMENSRVLVFDDDTIGVAMRF